MSLYDPLINYCERTGPGLLAEPINAVSNAAFFIAAWLLYYHYRKGPGDKQALTLIFLIALVGAGSTLFHTFANKLTELADIIPIAIFTFYYLWLALRKLVGCSVYCALAHLFVFAAFAELVSKIPPEYSFNGSIAYFPCWAAVLLIGTVLAWRKHPAARWILKAALVFTVSLTFRSIDYKVCADISVGTHFLWHCLNGLMLYLLTRPLISVKWR